MSQWLHLLSPLVITANIHTQATKNVTTSACGAPIRDRTKIVSYAGVVGGIIALLAFVLRMLARLSCCGGMFGVDDWTMVLTMVYNLLLY